MATKAKWTKRQVSMLGKHSDAIVANKTGHSVGQVRYMRRKLTISNSNLSYPDAWLTDALTGGTKASSGERVNEKIAMGLAVYLACIKNISEDIGKLPLGIYKHIEPRGSKRQRTHAADSLLHFSPNNEMTAMSFRETITAHALGYHGGFAEIVFDGAGRPAELWPLDPTTVQVMRANDPDSTLFYMVDGVPMDARYILHIHGLGYDGITGYCIARLAKDVIGNALASQKFSGSFFANGMTISGIIEMTRSLSDTAYKRFRESFHMRHGGASNSHKPLILEDGATYKPIAAKPQESQMVETLQMGDEYICGLFRMPPHKVGILRRATNNNIEQQALEYVQDTLLAWLVRWEQEIWRKLLLPRERADYFAKHNVNMLLRGDMTARSAFYREMFNIGALSDNDIRELEDLNPVDGGDSHFVNAALVPLDMAATGEHLKAKQDETPPKQDGSGGNSSDPKPPESDPKTNAAMKRSELNHRRELIGRIAAAHRKSIEQELSSILRVEHDKVTRASKRKDSYAWASDFYRNEHKKHVSERLRPHLEALATGVEAVLWN